MPKAMPSPALAELHQADIARGIDPLTIEHAPAPPQPPRQTDGFWIPRPDWDQEARERLALEEEQERRQRAAILAEELARLEDERSYPAAPTKPRRRWPL